MSKANTAEQLDRRIDLVPNPLTCPVLGACVRASDAAAAAAADLAAAKNAVKDVYPAGSHVTCVDAVDRIVSIVERAGAQRTDKPRLTRNLVRARALVTDLIVACPEHAQLLARLSRLLEIPSKAGKATVAVKVEG